MEKNNKLDSEKSLNLAISDAYEKIKYAGTGISEKEFNNIIQDILKAIKKDYTKSRSSSDYEIDNIQKQLDNQDFVFNFINDFINEKFNGFLNYAVCLKYFDELKKLFETFDFIPNKILISELLDKNEKFKTMVSTVYNHNIYQITSGKFKTKYENMALIYIIEVYCDINNIKLAQDEFSLNRNELAQYNLNNDLQMYLSDVYNNSLVSVDKRKELLIKAKNGDSVAREKFLESNMGFVVSVAKNYLGCGLEFLDLIQEGNIGLITALDKYDLDKGCEFSTFAYYWIRQAIVRAIAKLGRNIRIPVGLWEQIVRYKRAFSTLSVKLNREPTPEEMALEMNVPLRDALKYQKYCVDTISFNTIINDEDKTEMSAFIVDTSETVDELAVKDSLAHDVKILFSTCLSEREQEIIMLRFTNPPTPYKEIGKKLNLSSQAVFALTDYILRKLRNSEYTRVLAGYMENEQIALENLDNINEEIRKERQLKLERKKAKKSKK